MFAPAPEKPRFRDIPAEPDRWSFPVELRTMSIGGKPRIRGVPGVVNQRARIVERVGGKLVEFEEQFAPGAFRRSIASRADVVALVNHDANLILGRVASGTLMLSEAPSGDLVVEIDPDEEITHARNAILSIRRGDLRGMSIGFIPKPNGVRWSDRNRLRTITDCDLFDVSVVTRPAYKGTAVAVRSSGVAEFARLSPDGPRSPVMSRRIEAAGIRLRDLDRRIGDLDERIRGR